MFSRMARMLVSRFTITGLVSEELSSRRLRWSTISLYWLIRVDRDWSVRPTLTGNTVLSLSGAEIYSAK